MIGHHLSLKHITCILFGNMKLQNKYFFLAALFTVVLLVMELTDIYGDSGWVKVFFAILTLTFLLAGFSSKKDKSDKM